MNYSPVVHRSSSLESDYSASSKEQNEQENKIQPNNISSSTSILNANLKNGLKISKNSTTNIINEVKQPNQNQNTPTVKKDEQMQKPEESKVRRKLQAQRTFQRVPTTIQSRRSSLNKLVNSLSKTNLKESEIMSEKSENISKIHQNESKIENPAPSSLAENFETKTENVDLAIKTDKVNTDMKLDLDSEFEKYFQSTQLSDEAINEFYQKDFREEIYELERKFQELNEQNNEKIEIMKAANARLNHVVTSSGDSGSEEIPTPVELQWEEIRKTTNEASNMPDNFTRETKPTTIPMLGESQKADLLKALNNIDKDSNKNMLDDRIELPQISTSPMLTSDLSYLDKVNELKKSYSRTRRKSEVLKDLFGGDSAVLKS